jgi:hypothetical protein
MLGRVAAAAIVPLVLGACGSASMLTGTSTQTVTSVAVTASRPGVFAAPGMSISFDYPVEFRPMTLRQAQFTGRSTNVTRAAVGVGPYDLLIVDRFAGVDPVPVSPTNIAAHWIDLNRSVSETVGRR